MKKNGAKTEIYKIQKNEKTKSNEPQIDISNETNEPKRSDFKIQKVRGNWNCLLRAVLASININEVNNTLLRETLTNLIKDSHFSENILQDYGITNKEEMINHVSRKGEKISLDTLQILLDKWNLKIYIWHDNNISWKKWIILNKELNEKNSPTIYINYKDYKDKHPNHPNLAENYAHYDALINNTNPTIKNQTEKAKGIIQKMIDNTIERRHFE